MIRHGEEVLYERMEEFKGGAGHLLIKKLMPQSLVGNGVDLFAHNKLEKGCEIGWHVHETNCEFYYILKGSGEYNDNGTVVPVVAGNITYTPMGEGHSLRNPFDEPLEIIALVAAPRP